MNQKETLLHILDRLQIVSYVTARDLAEHQDILAAEEPAEAVVEHDAEAEAEAADEAAERAATEIAKINTEITTKITELRGNLDEAISKVLTWWSKPPPLLLDMYR